VSAPERKRLAGAVVKQFRCSARASCRYLGLNRGTWRYRAKEPDARQRRLEKAILEASRRHPTLGYRKIARKLREAGWRVNKKQVQRIRREDGLQVPPPRKKVRRRGVSTGLPTQATHRNHVWTWDFIADRTVRGGAVRVLTIMDEYTRECHVLRTDRRLTAADVLRTLQEAIELQGAPEYIRSDNGPEFIARAIQRWLSANRIKTIYIEPGCPWQNGYVESFHARLRLECLDRELLYTLTEARVVIEDWRRYYNTERPHRSLQYLTPERFAKKLKSSAPASSRATPSLRQALKKTGSVNQNQDEGNVPLNLG
jgi:transposase InsO family protein